MTSNNLLPILIFLAIISMVVIIAAFSFIIYLLVQNKKSTNNNTDLKNNEQEESSSIPKPTYTCTIHHDRPSCAACCICDQMFCSECIKEIDHLYFCPEHLTTYIKNNWLSITDQKTTAQEPHTSEYIYSFKKLLWKRNEPSFIITHYKIDVLTDQIESFVKLNVLKENSEKNTEEINKLKLSFQQKTKRPKF